VNIPPEPEFLPRLVPELPDASPDLTTVVVPIDPPREATIDVTVLLPPDWELLSMTLPITATVGDALSAVEQLDRGLKAVDYYGCQGEDEPELSGDVLLSSIPVPRDLWLCRRPLDKPSTWGVDDDLHGEEPPGPPPARAETIDVTILLPPDWELLLMTLPSTATVCDALLAVERLGLGLTALEYCAHPSEDEPELSGDILLSSIPVPRDLWLFRRPVHPVEV
jgi:hypothetical protein